MSILRKWLRLEPPTIQSVDSYDPAHEQRKREQETQIERERQQLRAKVQKVQSGSRVFSTAGGALAMMETRRGRNQ